VLSLIEDNALTLKQVTVFPMVLIAVRESCILLIWEGEYNTATIPFPKLAKLTTALVFFLTTVGLFLTKIEVVLAYKGAVLGSNMVYMFPGLFYVALRRMGIDETKLEAETLATNLLQKNLLASGGGGSGDNDGFHAGLDSALMEASSDIHERASREEAGGSARADSKQLLTGGGGRFSEGVAPAEFWPAVHYMFTTKAYWPCTLMFVWGFCTGILGTVLTAMNQADS
jgi:hypothetical protein